MPKKIKIKANTYTAITNALEYAVERGCNRHDKYAEEGKYLDERTRETLRREIDASFFLYLDDHGYVLE